MKIDRKIITDCAILLSAFALGLTVSACGNLNGMNGNVCNDQNQCVSFSEHPGSPAPASSYLTPTPESESPSASIPGITPSPTGSASPVTDLSSPPVPTEAPPTSTPVPETQFDSSLHRCKQSSDINTLLSLNVDNQLFTCMQIPPDQMNLLIQLVVLAVYDTLTHQPFNPPAMYAPQASEAQDVVAAYQGQSS